MQLFTTPFRKHFFVGLIVGIFLSIDLAIVSALSEVFGVDYISSWYPRLFGFVTVTTVFGSVGLLLIYVMIIYRVILIGNESKNNVSLKTNLGW